MIIGQRLPQNAVNIVKPTHQIIQIKVGVRLSVGFWLPNRPVEIIRAKVARERNSITLRTRLGDDAVYCRIV